MTTFLTIFRRFPTTFRRFTKIFQNCTEGQTNVSENFRTFPNIFRRLPKIAEDDRRRSEDLQSYTNRFKCKRDKGKMLSKMISSHVMISHRFYQFDTTRYFTGVYIINLYYSINRECRAIRFKSLKSSIFPPLSMECYQTNNKTGGSPFVAFRLIWIVVRSTEGQTKCRRNFIGTPSIKGEKHTEGGNSPISFTASIILLINLETSHHDKIYKEHQKICVLNWAKRSARGRKILIWRYELICNLTVL